jgi:hypothetical protein
MNEVAFDSDYRSNSRNVNEVVSATSQMGYFAVDELSHPFAS